MLFRSHNDNNNNNNNYNYNNDHNGHSMRLSQKTIHRWNQEDPDSRNNSK